MSDGHVFSEEKSLTWLNSELCILGRESVASLDDYLTYDDLRVFVLYKKYNEYRHRNNMENGLFSYKFIGAIPMIEMVDAHGSALPFLLLFGKDIYHIGPYGTITFDLMYDWKNGCVFASADLLDILDYSKAGEFFKTSGSTASESKRQLTYLMADRSTGMYKIGRSIEPYFREKTLQSQNPVIELICTCQVDIEKHLHEYYADQRVRGEWFNLSDEQVNEVIEIFEIHNT